MNAVAPIPELYIRWRDPETNRVVRMERVPEGMTSDAAIRTTRLAVQTYLLERLP